MTPAELKPRLRKALEFFISDIQTVRTGRATPTVLEDVTIQAYGSPMTLKELGSITVLDAQTLVVSPWDKNQIPAIVKAIRDSEMKLTPVDDGNVIRVPIPPLTEERRIELTKIVAKKAEEAKQTLRNIRQDTMKDIDKEFADKKIGEDDKFTQREEVEKIVKEFSEEIDTASEAKKKDLMTV